MARRRVLFLGPTGVDKRSVLSRVAEYAERELTREIEQIHFEKDYLSQTSSLSDFLDQSVKKQYQQWQASWNRFSDSIQEKTIEGSQGKDIFLSLHGCFTRGYYGTRLVADAAQVAKFRPHVIITLIDDIYDAWWRTEKRAGGDAWRGRPTLEHLVLARRVEAAFGDLVMYLSNSNPRHLLVAASHPRRTVSNVIYGNPAEVAYLSFPISEPRRMRLAGNDSGMKEVNEFIEYASEIERQRRRASIICPLAIDELPFVGYGSSKANECTIQHSTGGGRTIAIHGFNFPRDDWRWNLSDFWPEADRMKEAIEPGPAFLCDQLVKVSGNVASDVGWRDYRLAEQADRVCVFNPVMNGASREESGKVALAHGVTAEITHALSNGVPVYVYQDEKHDPNRAWQAWNDTIQGGTSMGQGQAGSRLIWVESIEKLFDNFAN